MRREVAGDTRGKARMPAVYNEIEAYPAHWLRNLIERDLIAAGRVEERSIVDLTPKDFADATQAHFFAGIGVWSHALRLAGWPDDVPVWTGSCPCQPFSSAGHRKGFDDERHLWPSWFGLISECRPPIVLGEQVGGPDGIDWLDVVLSDLEGAGYAAGAASLPACGVGAPHIRQRLYFVAYAEEQRRDAWRSTIAELSRQRWASEQLGRQGPAGDVADAVEQRREGRGLPVQSERPPEPEVARRSETRSLDDSGSAGAWWHGSGSGSEDGSEGLSDLQSAVLRRATSGFWADAEWIPCLDQTHWAIEPGTFPLAHGTPARVGRLRAYGNAIVAPLAATFIRSVMEVLDS
jgi:DNA (cytosine-5)-methyltransferase 1